MSEDARDSRRIKAATDKFLKRAGKKRGEEASFVLVLVLAERKDRRSVARYAPVD